MRFTLRMLALVIVAVVVSVPGLQSAHANTVSYSLPPAGTYIDTSETVNVGAVITPTSAGVRLKVLVILNGDGVIPVFSDPNFAVGETYTLTHNIETSHLQNYCASGEITIGLLVEIIESNESSFVIGETSGTYPCGSGPAPEVLSTDPSNFVIDVENCGDQNDVVRYVQANVSVLDSAWNGNDLVFTLQANTGYTFPEGTTTTITYTDPGNCVIEGQIPLPIHTEQCGSTNDMFENAEGLPTGVNRDFTVTWNGNVATITYSALEGYVFAPGAVTAFTFTDEGKACIEPSISVVPNVDDPFVDIRFGETTVPVTVTLDLPAGEKYLIADIDVELDTFIFLTPYEHLSEIVDWPADFEYVIELNGNVLNHICDDGVIVLLTDATVHTEVTWFDMESEPVTYPCNVLFPVTPDTELMVVTDVCGPNNDEIAFDQENVIATIGEWEDGEAIITFQPAEGYYFTQGTVKTHTVTDEASDCVIEPASLPDLATAICGPNNDAISLPDQPQGVLVEDSGWDDNERTITLAPDDGYAFPVGTATEYRYEDENIPCEEPEPGVTQVTVLLVTSDGGSIEGTPYQLYAPVASQVPSAPFIEGEVAAGNRIVIINLVAGQYRLVLAPAGYEEVDTVLTVTEGEDTQEITVEVAAVQVPATPTPSPTSEPTASPTPSPTSEPVAQVSGLPSTGAGSGNGNLIAVVLSSVAAITALAWIGGRRLGTHRR